MEQERKETNATEWNGQPPKKRLYHKPWVRVTALILAVVMIFSIWANGAIQIQISRGDDMDAAVNYLVDNTDYINQDEWARLQEQLLAYQKATELEDYYRLAGTQIADASYEEALVSIEKCIELYPGGDDSLYVDLILKRACLLVLLLREEEALEALDLVLKHQPDHADAYLIKAQIYAERVDLEPLADALSGYLTYRPEDYSIHLVYAQTLFELQRFDEAISEYQLLLDTESDQLGNGEIWYLLGLTRLQVSDYAASEEALVQAKQVNPSLEGLDYYIGVCQMSREAYEEAIQSFTAAIEAGSMLQHCYYSRGVCRAMLNGSDPAVLEDLRFASEYDGENADPTVKQQSDDLLAQLQGVINSP